MNAKAIDRLFRWMQRFAVLAGEIALQHQGKAKNQKKETIGVFVNPATTALTIIDEAIQELFLAHIYSFYPGMKINAEEDTPLRKLFENGGEKKGDAFSPYTAHIDPIDGTLAYTRGEPNFAVGLAISDARQVFTHSVICLPAAKRLFAASPKGWAVLDQNFKKIKLSRKWKKSSTIYEKRLLSPRGRRELEKMGFSFPNFPATHIGVLRVALGRDAGLLCGGGNPHDVMLPYPFAKANGIEPVNIHGFKIKAADWKIASKNGLVRFKRIPSTCYFSCSVADQKKILGVLGKKSNLHPEYLKHFARLEKNRR